MHTVYGIYMLYYRYSLHEAGSVPSHSPSPKRQIVVLHGVYLSKPFCLRLPVFQAEFVFKGHCIF